MKRQVWTWGVLALVAVWVAAGVGVWLARSQRMTAGKTVAYLESHPLQGLPAGQREQIIAGMADRVNKLSFEERQKFRYEGRLREWFEELTPEERLRYIDLTLPKGMKQMMEAFNKMPTLKRKQLVSRALADLDRVREETGHLNAERVLSDANMQRIVDEGMKTFIRDASADTKLDLQPLIEQMQNIMQRSR
ncbi:MAG: hypothetical protein PCFJNLEI_04125 [Verrucomicrobiae bacterium]|nr:hypothetical protein [Verrucomicrobiae bacterium]